MRGSRRRVPLASGGLVFALQLCCAAGLPAQQERPRSLASVRVIAPAAERNETFSGPFPLTEVVQGIPDLEWTPNYLAKTETLLAMARGVTLRRPSWCLEFAFKPLRMVEVDVPQPSGKMKRKLVWYMVYRVRNLGNDVQPVGPAGEAPAPAGEVPPRRFLPHFVLESRDLNKAYLNQVIPAAKRVIAEREDLGEGVPLYNSTEICQVPVEFRAGSAAPGQLPDYDLDPGVWGYVTWVDIDPRIDFFSIYVRGLTNAYRFADQPGAFKQGDPPRTGREFTWKTLQLNYWRPGDSVFQHEEELRFGVPIESDPARQTEVLKHYGLSERLDYLWVYR